MGVISGTSGNDTIFGTGGGDTIQAGAGNDVIYSAVTNGAGIYSGDDGDDWIIIRGPAGPTLYGNYGNDHLEAFTDGGAVIHDYYGDDIIISKAGGDRIFMMGQVGYNGDNHDIVVLGGGNDVIYGLNYLEHKIDIGGAKFTGVQVASGDTKLNYSGGSVVIMGLTSSVLADWNALTTTLYSGGVATGVAQAYRNVLRTDANNVAANLTINTLVDAYNNKTMTLGTILQSIESQAKSTTSVATTMYQFYTGKAPALAGIDYLVAKDGPNPNSLNAAYYQAFNIENRYVNFSVNLGKYGAGAESFKTKYQGLSLLEATKGAYKEIFGWELNTQKANSLLYADVGGMTRAAYFATYGGDGADGIGTKAAMVGWLMTEAVKADVGMYARANANFIHDLMDGAAAGVDLVGTYGAAEYAPWWGV